VPLLGLPPILYADLESVSFLVGELLAQLAGDLRESFALALFDAAADFRELFVGNCLLAPRTYFGRDIDMLRGGLASLKVQSLPFKVTLRID